MRMRRDKAKMSGGGVVSVVANAAGALCPEIDEQRCGRALFSRLAAAGNIVAATGVTTGYTVAAGRKFLITGIQLCAAAGADISLKIYDGDPATANFLGAVALPTLGTPFIHTRILIDASAGAITPWVDVGTTATLDFVITGIEWTERTV